MKSLLLAAAAFIAAPAIAQEQPAPTVDQTAPAPTGDSTTAADPAMQAPPAPTGGDTMTTTGSTMSTPAPAGAGTAGDPVGGYQPSTPPMQGTPAAGATVRFQQAPDPATAYPAPAAMEKYPVCKKGQYDKCIQRGGK